MDDAVFAQPVRFKNVGFFPARDIRFYCFAIVTSNPLAPVLATVDVVSGPFKTANLNAGESQTITCNLRMDHPVSVDISAIARYRTWGVPFWSHEDIQRHTSARASDNTFHYLPQTSDPLKRRIHEALEKAERTPTR